MALIVREKTKESADIFFRSISVFVSLKMLIVCETMTE